MSNKMNERTFTVAAAIILAIVLMEAVVGISGIKAIVVIETSQAGTLAGVTLPDRKAPLSISGDNVYVAWSTNDTANQNEDVMFRASNDGGQTFGEKINLSNTTDAGSMRLEIDSDADNVIVTWWEANETDDIPVMTISNDNGATFGHLTSLFGTTVMSM
jgi:hypothetical protein